MPGGIRERIVMFLERGAVDAHALREDLLDERPERHMPPAERGEIAKRVQRTLDLLCVAMLTRHRGGHSLQLIDERTVCAGLGACVVDERARQHDVEKGVVVQIVTKSNRA